MAITNTTIQDLVGSTEKVLGATINFIAPGSNELVQSGLTARGPAVDAVAGGGPRKSSIPYLNPLSTDEINVSTDNINDEGSVGSMSGDEFEVLRHDLNYGWGFADLQRIVTQYDAKGGVAGMIADYQNGIDKKLLTSALKGTRAVVEAAAADVDDPVTGITFDVETDFAMSAIYDAIATGEEWSPLFNVMLVSYGRYAKLQADEKGFVPPSKTGTRFADYQGFSLLKTNTLTDDQIITARTGAVAYGAANPAGLVPVEYERRANAGNGGGGDILHSRFSRVVHPQGLNYKGSVPGKATNIYTDLETAANWSLDLPAAQFGFRFINFNVEAGGEV